MERSAAALFALLFLITALPVAAGDNGDARAIDRLDAETFEGLQLRALGPALTSGRVVELAVDPEDRSIYYVAAASGGVWKTTNRGTTWKPIFDDEGSYSIGTITIDPNDPLVLWVGTGENNSQRSVSYGDGVYKSVDGGTTWERMGLEESEHIARIVVDPRDSEVVYVAAQGPLWSPGGDRGLYKTVDGGVTWERVLEISEHTGVTDLVMDPRNPDILYAAAYQRRRHVWTLVNGGPESAIYKTVDGGASWRELTEGLPEEEMGRIGLAVSPVDPDVVYAIIESIDDAGGFFRSQDGGINWEKRSDYLSGSPQYYQEIVPDPRDVDRVYSLDVWTRVTEDGGKTFHKVGSRHKHVDDHALWIDPDDTRHLLIGNDGGVYETFDRGSTWEFKANLPLTQFYKLAVDNDLPFYNVYGGTQDNNTLGGPSRTISRSGITNGDWFVTVGGDGFQPRIDPENPDIVYSQWQHGNLVRFDRASGETIDIQPQPAAGEALKWNWDSPLIISPHSPARLYFGANRLFRSDDRGDSWTVVSPDLTRGLDRNAMEVMGKVWSVDTPSKNRSTSVYGNLVALSESPLAEGLIYTGADDGLVQVTADGGATWRPIESVPGVDRLAYVADLVASRHDADTVYALFDNHKMGDFRPYVLRSRDRGASWTSIAGDLPGRGTAYSLVEDPIDPDLLLVGTEFGVFFTLDGGGRWIQLTGGIPVIAVRDLEIQEREGDLVLGTFGRGFYVLDDYSPLRGLTAETLEEEAVLFPVKKTWMYIESEPLSLPGKAFMGDAFYTAPNPPFGAVFTYYLADDILSSRERRRESEEEVAAAGGKIAYPAWEELQAEDREEEPAMLLEIRDAAGRIVRRLTGPAEEGFHRVAWDLRFPAADPTSLEEPDDSPFADPIRGPMVLPGPFTVTLAKRLGGQVIPVGEPQTFETESLGLATLAAADRGELVEFQQRVARLQRAALGSVRAAAEARSRVDHLQQALLDTPGADPAIGDRLLALEHRLADLGIRLSGDPTKRSRYAATPPSIVDRTQSIVSAQWASSSAPTATSREAYRIAGAELTEVVAELRQAIEADLVAIEDEMEAAGAPWTPGRVPRWQPE